MKPAVIIRITVEADSLLLTRTEAKVRAVP